MSVTRLRFEQVEIRATRRWVENGKKRQQTQRFSQTINPFNKTSDGRIKDRETILAELRERRDAWLASNGGSNEK